jgi:hypothetical protein
MPRGNLCDKIDDAHRRLNWPTGSFYPKVPTREAKTGTAMKIHTQRRTRALFVEAFTVETPKAISKLL